MGGIASLDDYLRIKKSLDDLKTMRASAGRDPGDTFLFIPLGTLFSLDLGTAFFLGALIGGVGPFIVRFIHLRV
jgi:hypothetical protein